MKLREANLLALWPFGTNPMSARVLRVSASFLSFVYSLPNVSRGQNADGNSYPSHHQEISMSTRARSEPLRRSAGGSTTVLGNGRLLVKSSGSALLPRPSLILVGHQFVRNVRAKCDFVRSAPALPHCFLIAYRAFFICCEPSAFLQMYLFFCNLHVETIV